MAKKDKFKFEIEGINEVKKMLDSIPKKINDKILYDINRAGAKIVKEQLSNDTPSGDNNKKADNKAENNVIIVKGKKNKTAVVIGFASKVWYIINIIERGTKLRKLLGRGKYRAGTERGSVTRKPFIAQSHAKAAPKVIEFFTTNYLKLVDKALKKQVNRINRMNKKKR